MLKAVCTLIVLGLMIAPLMAQVHVLLPDDPNEVKAREFVRLVSEYAFEAATADFDSTMSSLMTPGRLDQTWATLLGQVGRFKRQTSVRKEQIQGHEAVLVTCEFDRATLDARVVINPDGQIAGLFFVPSRGAYTFDPPAYASPDSLKERDVSFGAEEWLLPGTLSVPGGDGPFPALVLIHGSGPNDRDETIGPNKPFRDLAWGLASRGIAVLRYEKRTRAHALKMADLRAKITVEEEVVQDALAAVAFLRAAPEVDSSRVFVLGHSLGGMLLPKIAAREDRIAGMVVMAGPSRPLEDLILEQVVYISGLDGPLTEEENQQLEELAAQVDRVKSDNLETDTPSSELPLGIGAAYWLNLRDYDPAQTAAELSLPILVLHGERDYQVTMADYEGWQSALLSSERTQFRLYPTLNHLFLAGEGKSTPSEYEAPGHVDESVITDIGNWIDGVVPN